MIVAALAVLAAQLSTDAPATAAKLEPGTELKLVTTEPLDSRTARQGQRFGLALEDDLMQSGMLVLPRGTKAVGEIETVRQKQMFGMPGSLVLRPMFIEFAGRRVNLEGALTSKGASGKAGAIPGVIIAGSLGLILTGRSAHIPAGTHLSARVR